MDVENAKEFQKYLDSFHNPKGKMFNEILELSVRYENMALFRSSIAKTKAQIINVVEIKHNELLLFIVNINGSNRADIIDIGFQCSLKNPKGEG